MIFVTVGTAAKGIEFNRLIETMDRLAGELELDMLIQKGHARYETQHARSVCYLKYSEALEQFRSCDLVVAHCGAGTIMNALHFNKPMILVPRRAGRGENADDHQLELAEAIADMQGVWIVHEVDELEPVLRQVLAKLPIQSKPTNARLSLMSAISQFIDDSTRPPKGRK